MSNLLTTKELSNKLKVTRQAISLWVKQGMPYETRRPLRFNWEDVKDWLNNREYDR